jgi:hypothetical protein
VSEKRPHPPPITEQRCEICNEPSDTLHDCQECGAQCCPLCICMTDKGDFCVNCDSKHKDKDS